MCIPPLQPVLTSTQLELPFLVTNKDIPSLEKRSYFFMGGNYTPPLIILGSNFSPTQNRGKYQRYYFLKIITQYVNQKTAEYMSSFPISIRTKLLTNYKIFKVIFKIKRKEEKVKYSTVYWLPLRYLTF